jgi:hypothetical protein
MRILKGSRSRYRTAASRVGLVLAVTVGGLAATATPSFAAAGVLTVAAATAKGPSGGGNVISVTTTNATSPTTPVNFTGTLGVEFSYQACAATYTTPTNVTAAGTTPVLTGGVVDAPTFTIVSTTSMSITVPAGLALPATPVMASASFFVCVYAGTTNASSTLVSGSSTPAYAIVPNPSLNTNTGPDKGGNTLTLTAPTGTFTGTPAVEFQYRGTGAAAGCSSGFQAAVTPVSSTGTQTAGVVVVPPANVTIPASQTAKLTVAVPATLALNADQSSAEYHLCVYSGNTPSTSQIVAGTLATQPYVVAGAALTLNTYKGPSPAGNTLTATVSADTFVTGAVGVEFQYVGTGSNGCTPTYKTGANITASSATVQTGGIVEVPAANLKVLSGTKLAITVPLGTNASTPKGLYLLGSPAQVSADYNVCVYNGSTNNSSTLIAGTQQAYTISPKSVVNSVTPATGSAQGSTKITVSGTFPSAITSASIGGVNLTGIVLVSPTTFTAVTQAHVAGGPYPIVVSTAGGTTTSAALFSFANAINVTPATASNDRNVDVDVQGVGFSSITFSGTMGTTPNDANGHVYLVKGVYDPTKINTSFKLNPQTLECLDIFVVSDNELACTMHLTGDGNRVAYPSSGLTLTDGVTANGSYNLNSALSTFTTAHIGMAVSGQGIPSGTTITTIVDANNVLLSNKATNTLNSGAATLAAPRTGLTASTDIAVNANKVTGAGFLAGDVGRLISGPGIRPGTTITAVNGTTDATLSQPATATATSSANYSVGVVPVPVGVYTVTVVSDGALDVQAGGTAVDSGFSQSVVSSGSTFTVADF